MKICATSDTHGYFPEIPNCDILCVCGDISPANQSHTMCHQTKWFNEFYIPWINSLKCQVVVIPGNHDFLFLPNNLKHVDKSPKNFHLLIDSACEIDGIKFYGSPWVTGLNAWAFNTDKQKEYFSSIPEGLDMLITHSPPRIAGIDIDASLDDICHGGSRFHWGSFALTTEIEIKKPNYCIFGHIHTGLHAPVKYNDTTLINVSYLNEQYVPKFPPIIFDINNK